MQKPFFSDKYNERSRKALSVGLGSVPMYDAWRQYDPGSTRSVDDRYSALPVLTKEDLRTHFPQGLVPKSMNTYDGIERGDIEFVQTSGTTAEKVTNLWNQVWWNASEAASWKLNSNTAQLDGSQREAQLTSALNVGFKSEIDLPMDERILGNRFLFLNEKAGANEWEPRHFGRMVAELSGFKPVIIEANPSYLGRLAWWAIDNEADIFLPKAIIFTYELPSAVHLKSVRRVFPVPFASSYGTTEAGYVFMQCERGVFHQNTEYCRVDYEPFVKDHGGPFLGRILVTTFGNPWTSLIRFDVGDIVRLDERGVCACGRKEGFMLESIEGRIRDATFTTNGRLVSTKQADDALAAVDGIRDWQIEQISRREYVLRIALKGDSAKIIGLSRRVMLSLYGNDAELSVTECREILPGPSGKYRRTLSRIGFDIKELLA
jgi:phenylacetate-coenzyme A ligase PaaK-like adenylate-forming protein